MSQHHKTTFSSNTYVITQDPRQHRTRKSIDPVINQSLSSESLIQKQSLTQDVFYSQRGNGCPSSLLLCHVINNHPSVS